MKLLPWTWIVFFAYWAYGASGNRKTVVQGRAYSPHLILTVLAFALVFPAFPLGPLDRFAWPPVAAVQWLGFVLTLMFQAVAVWARVHLGKYWSAEITLKEGHKVIDTGPYRWVRHPIYTGFIFGLTSSALAVGRWRSLLAVAVIVLAYGRKISHEEAFLNQELGDEYRAYSERTRRLLPFVI